MQMIFFTLTDKNYAMPSAHVEEIIKSATWVPVPLSAEWIQGLINLKGNVITLINLQKFLYPSEEREKLCYNNTIIIKNETEKIALIVDDVKGVRTIEPSDIQQMNHQKSSMMTGVMTVNKEVVNVINMEALFSINEG